MRDYQARLGKPFLHDAYLSELTSLRDHLKARLSATAHQPEGEEGPSDSDLAEKIKTLKAAHNIEATPQRVRQKHSAAEEPVTARIRRRAEGAPASDQANGHDIAPEPEAGIDAASLGNSPIKSPMPFQVRAEIQRQRKSEGPQSPA